jgi:hypothetical protein
VHGCSRCARVGLLSAVDLGGAAGSEAWVRAKARVQADPLDYEAWRVALNEAKVRLAIPPGCIAGSHVCADEEQRCCESSV